MKISAVSSAPMLKSLTSSTPLKYKTTYYNTDELLKTCQVKETKYKRPHIIKFHLYESS